MLVVAMTEQNKKPIVFRCPATGIDVISSVHIDPVSLSYLPDHPLMLACFCGDSHAVLLKRFVSKKSTVRRTLEPVGTSAR